MKASDWRSGWRITPSISPWTLVPAPRIATQEIEREDDEAADQPAQLDRRGGEPAAVARRAITTASAAAKTWIA